MSETKFVNHVNAPHNQPFNVKGRPNQTKKNSWWRAGSSTFWRDRAKEGKRAKKNSPRGDE